MTTEPNLPDSSHADLLAKLRLIPILTDICDDYLEWLIAHGTEGRLRAGEYLARAGEPAKQMLFLLEGAFEARPAQGAPEGPTFLIEAPRISGALPFSRMKSFPMDTRALRPMHFLALDTAHFPAMYQALPDLIPRLVGILTDRVREAERQNTQHEKLAALGKLSAGLAHELNNPAAAARQAASSARQLFGCYQELLDDYAAATFTATDLQTIRHLEQRSAENLATTQVLDSLARADREDKLSTWLEAEGIEKPWMYSPNLADAGWTLETLKAETANLSPGLLPLVLDRLVGGIELLQALNRIQTSTQRMGELVSAMKDYSFMDRASITEFDLNHSLATTLTLFGFRFKRGIQLETSYDPNLPMVCANGGQLNQVWTNLIDNALDAIDDAHSGTGNGRLIVTTRQEVDGVLVTFEDNGPGIPSHIAARIFDPFFTTKPQGEGTGLGLDMVYRIIQQHHGDVRFESVPGRTCFLVRLPLKQPTAAELAQAS
ncbi:MAG: ATP-binding protein [Bryobacter sp.]|nr:ATP-binding protein [Bryobacter sp.]